MPNEDGGRCRDVGQSSDGLPAFLYLQPCLASESVDVGFNTLEVSNGEHHLVVSVLDPAGNSAPVLDREIDVQNPVATPVKQSSAVEPGSTLAARARLTLKIQPRRVGPRERVEISGRLLGGQIPKGGKLVVLEARQRHGLWLKFDVLRAGAPGAVSGQVPVSVAGCGGVGDSGGLRTGGGVSVCYGVV